MLINDLESSHGLKYVPEKLIINWGHILKYILTWV